MIFLIAAFGFFGLMANSHKAEVKARQTLAATSLARELLETSRSRGYAALKVGTEQGSRSVVTSRNSVPGQSLLEYTLTVTQGSSATYKAVQAVVVWKGGRIDMESYVTP